MITTTDLTKLRALTKAASKAPWTLFNQNLMLEIHSARGMPVIHWAGFDGAPGSNVSKTNNASYIAAADPSVILSLIAEIEEARKK